MTYEDDELKEKVILKYVQRLSKLANHVYLAIWGNTGVGWENVDGDDLCDLVEASGLLYHFIEKYDPVLFETETKTLFSEIWELVS